MVGTSSLPMVAGPGAELLTDQEGPRPRPGTPPMHHLTLAALRLGAHRAWIPATLAAIPPARL